MTVDGERAPLDPHVIAEGLVGTGRAWRRLDVVDETGSSNADLIARAVAGEDIGGAVLLAEHQTAGRGRSGRTWSGIPRAQIIMSFGVSTEGVPGDAWGWAPLATGVAVVDAVAGTTGIRAGLKWPNDVLADGGKLAGILAEVASPRPVIVVGIGLNVTLLPEEIAEPGATSLVALEAADVNRDELARNLLLALATRFEAWRTTHGNDPALRDDYRDRSLTIGSGVRAVLPGERDIVGTARSIDDQGRLVIDTADGRAVSVSAGDIVHLRGGAHR